MPGIACVTIKQVRCFSTNDHCCIDTVVGHIGASRIYIGPFSAGVVRDVNLRHCIPADDLRLKIKLASDLEDDEIGDIDLALEMGSELTRNVTNGDANYDVAFIVEPESSIAE